MYLVVDIGGTKTIAGAFDYSGKLQQSVKFKTDKDYDEFLKELESAINSLGVKDFSAGAVAVIGPIIDRKRGLMVKAGNLPWHNAPVQRDIEKIANCPVVIENDAKLAALSEAMLLKDKFSIVLYVTISTGIGFGLVADGVIDETVGDGGGYPMLLEHKGGLTSWENFASGRAITEIYGKRAEDIHDEETWRTISKDIAKGFIHLIAIMQPEVIIMGGGVGNYFDRFKKYLEEDLENYKMPIVKLPVLLKAQKPDEAVIYGCYHLAKQRFPHAESNK